MDNKFEETGEKYYRDTVGGIWKKTSYNTYAGEHLNGGTPYRYNFAQPGYTFDETKGTDGAFIPPKPYPSWILNENTFRWEAPVACPTDGYYEWAEPLKQWVHPVQ